MSKSPKKTKRTTRKKPKISINKTNFSVKQAGKRFMHSSTFKIISGIFIATVVFSIGAGIAWVTQSENFDKFFSRHEQAATSTHTAPAGVVGNEPYKPEIVITAEELHNLTNQHRKEAGLPLLSINSALNASAKSKCKDMIADDYWSHTAPDGTEFSSFIDAEGYVYSVSGENLAYGYYSSLGAVNGWMASPSHKENLLLPGYTEEGFGICKAEDYLNGGEETIIVQHFGAPQQYVEQHTPPSTRTICSAKMY